MHQVAITGAPIVSDAWGLSASSRSLDQLLQSRAALWEPGLSLT